MPNAPLVLVTASTDSAGHVVLPVAYVDALVAAALVPLVLPPVDASVAVAALARVDGLVLTGGEDIDPRWWNEAPHPAAGVPHTTRDACEIALVRAAAEQRVPTLALCRGAQIASVALGGTVLQDIADVAPTHARGSHRVHDVSIDAGSRLAEALGTARLRVNSSHHQAIGRIGDGLRVVGRSDDGLVEGIESIDRAWWMLGVQWHPEELTHTDEAWDRRLFAAFGQTLL